MPQPPPYLQGTAALPHGQIRIPSGLVITVFRAPGGRLYTDHRHVSGPFQNRGHLLLAIRRRFGCEVQLEVTQGRAPSPVLPEDPHPLPPPSEKIDVASVAESASALTLQEPEHVPFSEDLLDYYSSGEESVTDSNDSSPSVSSLGSEILIRNPANWYQTYFIRIDSSGYFHMYPDLGGPFQSLDQADRAISDHIAKIQRPPVLMDSIVDRLIHEHNYYPDGTPKRGPNSRRRTHPNEQEHCLVQALLDQYNGTKNLFKNHALELDSLVKHKLIYERRNRLYYHFNFTTKTGNLFFAEVLQGKEGVWKVTCCCMIDANENGLCNGCINNGCPDMKHPNNTDAYTHLNGYLQYGEGELIEPDDALEAEADRLRFVLKDLDDPDAMKRIYLRAKQWLSSTTMGCSGTLYRDPDMGGPFCGDESSGSDAPTSSQGPSDSLSGTSLSVATNRTVLRAVSGSLP